MSKAVIPDDNFLVRIESQATTYYARFYCKNCGHFMNLEVPKGHAISFEGKHQTLDGRVIHCENCECVGYLEKA